MSDTKLFGGSFLRDWRKHLDSKSKGQQLSKHETAIREMITEITGLSQQIKLGGALLKSANNDVNRLSAYVEKLEAENADLRKAMK